MTQKPTADWRVALMGAAVAVVAIPVGALLVGLLFASLVQMFVR